MATKERAVCVVNEADQLLVIRRFKDGRHYSVLPGGGIEHGESPLDAAIREFREESGLDGHVVRHLATLEHEDRIAHYYLVSALARPLRMNGPELEGQSETNLYDPTWVSLADIGGINLQPAEIRPLIATWR